MHRLRGGRQPGDIDHVLDSERNAVQRSAPISGGYCLLDRFRFAEGIGRDAVETVQLVVEAANTAKI